MNPQTRPLKVFICHSSGDKPAAREIYRYLTGQGVDAWLDEEKLLPGQDWQFEIPGALEDADAVLICLSDTSIRKEGYVQKEIKLALERAKEKPDGVIFIIPVRLEDCEVPRSLRQWQWVDLYGAKGYDKLGSSLTERAKSIGADPPAKTSPAGILNLQTWANIKFVYVAAGPFSMGSKPNNPLSVEAEQSQHRVEMPYDYYLGKYPVTNAQFNQFIQATEPKNIGFKEWQKKPDHPAVNISWHSARAYCHWLNQTIGAMLPGDWQFRLPTEAEWEKAARGVDGREWPWGNVWDPTLCNSMESGEEKVTRVGIYSPGSDGPFGAADMAGNVWEWTLNLLGREGKHSRITSTHTTHLMDVKR